MILDLFTLFYEGLVLPGQHFYRRYQSLGGAREIANQTSQIYRGSKHLITSYVKTQAQKAEDFIVDTASIAKNRLYEFGRRQFLIHTLNTGLLIGEAEDPQVLNLRLDSYQRKLARKKTTNREGRGHSTNRSSRQRNSNTRNRPQKTGTHQEEKPDNTPLQKETVLLNPNKMSKLSKKDLAAWILIQVEESNIQLQCNGREILLVLAKDSRANNLKEAGEIILGKSSILNPEDLVLSFIRKISPRNTAEKIAHEIVDLFLKEEEIPNADTISSSPQGQGKGTTIYFDLNPQDEEVITNFLGSTTVSKKLVRNFLGLNEVNQTSLNSEVLKIKLAFIEYLNKGSNKSLSAASFINEYNAFIEYIEFDSELRTALDEKLGDLRKNSPLERLRTKVELLQILQKEQPNPSAAIQFIDDIKELDDRYVYGVDRLIRKVASYHDEHIEGLFNEAAVALKLKKNPNYSNGIFNLSVPAVGEVKDLDLKIDIDGIVYYIEIKSSLLTAGNSIRQLTSLCNQTKTTRNHISGCEYVPVCLISNIDRELEWLESRREDPPQLKSLTAMSTVDNLFDIWNADGNTVLGRIKTASSGFRRSA